MGSGTLSLVGARLGSQTLAVVGERMGFQALSNEVAGVGDAGSCGSCGCRVGFQTLLQAASIVFFLASEHFLPGNSNAK